MTNGVPILHSELETLPNLGKFNILQGGMLTIHKIVGISCAWWKMSEGDAECYLCEVNMIDLQFEIIYRMLVDVIEPIGEHYIRCEETGPFQDHAASCGQEESAFTVG